ncbi:MAG: ribonuclease Z [Candidatus Shikimatogenerans bostrichidophilus]|nr:MAG: ribonuclease Z [Candidatus Shikimatogenerans bostrichidophilus]
MEKSFLIILGYNSSLPFYNHHPTSQILYMKNNFFLIDCGEGTQTQLLKSKIKINKINNIFISHLHGDHYFGLISILSTYQLLRRNTLLTIYSPKGLKEIIKIHLKWSYSNINYPLRFVVLSSTKQKKIYENKNLKVYTLPLKHKIYTNGFIFKEKKNLKKLKIERIKKIKEINIKDYRSIQKGYSFIKKNGSIIPNKYLTYNRVKSLTYAFCSDTKYSPNIVKYLKKVDLLYHETTYLHKYEKLAYKRGHSTSVNAATIAKKSKSKKLIIGHFSNRFTNKSLFKKEAKKIFKNTIIPKTLKKYYI